VFCLFIPLFGHLSGICHTCRLAEIEPSTRNLSGFFSHMRRHISVELKRVALRLALVRRYKYKRIRQITGISERTTQRIRALYRDIGDVARRRMVNGRPRILNGFEISVADFVLHHKLILNNAASFSKAVLNNSQICS